MVLEPMQRDGYCRCCDHLLEKENKTAIKFHSHRNRGQNIIICIPCSLTIGKMAKSYVDTGEFIYET